MDHYEETLKLARLIGLNHHASDENGKQESPAADKLTLAEAEIALAELAERLAIEQERQTDGYAIAAEWRDRCQAAEGQRAAYERELADAATVLQGALGIGQAKAIGLREVAAGVGALVEEAKRLTDENTQLKTELADRKASDQAMDIDVDRIMSNMPPLTPGRASVALGRLQTALGMEDATIAAVMVAAADAVEAVDWRDDPTRHVAYLRSQLSGCHKTIRRVTRNYRAAMRQRAEAIEDRDRWRRQWEAAETRWDNHVSIGEYKPSRTAVDRACWAAGCSPTQYARINATVWLAAWQRVLTEPGELRDKEASQ